MKFVFNGDYTNGRDSMKIMGVTFNGREPSDVEGEASIAKLRNHPEFSEVRSREPKPAKKAWESLKEEVED
ncbi:MAG: hypothetical protein ACREUQ_10145 [Burkholderiales bacterium]